jgi:hypothetical protein
VNSRQGSVSSWQTLGRQPLAVAYDENHRFIAGAGAVILQQCDICSELKLPLIKDAEL